jgi:hypothetical protein
VSIQAGFEYILDIEKELLPDPIVWVKSKLKPKYVSWEDINGKIVKVKSRTRILSVYYIVILDDIPEDPFYVSKKFLKEITFQNTVKCVCEIRALMNCGCQCGAFQKENSINE